MECNEEYFGELAGTFGERIKEYLGAPLPIYDHQSRARDSTSIEDLKIVGREGHSLGRSINESIFIRVNSPTLTRNVEKFNLPRISDRILFINLELKIKNKQETRMHNATPVSYITRSLIEQNISSQTS